MVYTTTPPISGMHQETQGVFLSPVLEGYTASILPLCFSDLVLQSSAFLQNGWALSHAWTPTAPLLGQPTEKKDSPDEFPLKGLWQLPECFTCHNLLCAAEKSLWNSSLVSRWEYLLDREPDSPQQKFRMNKCTHTNSPFLKGGHTF